MVGRELHYEVAISLGLYAFFEVQTDWPYPYLPVVANGMFLRMQPFVSDSVNSDVFCKPSKPWLKNKKKSIKSLWPVA